MSQNAKKIADLERRRRDAFVIGRVARTTPAFAGRPTRGVEIKQRAFDLLHVKLRASAAAETHTGSPTVPTIDSCSKTSSLAACLAFTGASRCFPVNDGVFRG
jgi:hypothetical protein